MLGYAIAGATAAAVVAAGYHTMAPRSQLYGRTFIGAPGSRQLALTYDDGPNDPHTLRLVEVLARHNVRATFFVLGKFVAVRPDIVREIVRAGHAVANHTYSHRNLIFATRAQVAAEIRDCEHAITDALGESLCERGSVTRAGQRVEEPSPHFLFRPPFGARRPAVLRTAREMGYLPVMWSVAGRDWRAPGAIEIERAIARQVRGGDVILLHDGGHAHLGANRSQTFAATDNLIARFKGEGYEFATVPEMIGGS